METQTSTTQIQPLAINQTNDLVVKIYGDKLNSPKLERRKLFVETVPRIGVNELIQILETVRSWLKRFSYQFPTNTPWWHLKMCPYCKETVLRNRDMITSLNGWKSAHCLRHSVIYFPNIAWLIDNKVRAIRITYSKVVSAIIPMRMIYYTWSHKYMATYDITEKRAIVYWRRDGNNRVTRFIYRNHLDSYPLMSAFATLLLNLSRELFTLQLELEEPKLANVYLNGELVKPLKT